MKRKDLKWPDESELALVLKAIAKLRKNNPLVTYASFVRKVVLAAAKRVLSNA